ncbi:protein BTG3-like [Heteronotia binoei]|uniref:protein BTG3-like n=1 Tax=Heteronotia binoei TaxID=13085 RepID=UPI0029308231|nr:protein BTG3-like [Heteronotia binoei]
MKEEVETGVRFISRLVNRHDKLAKEQVRLFGESLVTVLCERFNQHWYPENPLKGQAYRCIRINRWQKVDDTLLKACTDCGLDYSELALPREVSIWIDPGEVCCRLGENNQYFKVKDEERSSGRASPELETSDYHSESPSECSSEDEGPAKTVAATPAAPSKNQPAGSSSTKQTPQYFYMPSPLWVPNPQPLISYIPAYPPVTVYYIDVASKPPARRKPNPNLVKRLTNRASKA